MSHHLAIAMLNYRTSDLTIDCIASLADQIDLACDRLVVVDNGSKDGSVERIEKAMEERGWAEWARVLALPTNVGFSAGVNAGIGELKADYYLVINNDTIVCPGALASLLTALEEHPEVGLVTPRFEDLDGSAQVGCFRNRSPINEFLRAACTGPITKLLHKYDVPMLVSDEPTRPDWLGFPCVLIRRELIDDIGLLEKGYFLYFDDIDYCRRAWRAGWEVMNWPEARVVHLGGASNPLGSLAAARRRKPYYYYASRAWYFAKFYGRTGLILANVLWMAGRMISAARELVGNKQPHVSKREWVDIWTNCLNPFKPAKRWEADASQTD